MKNSIYKKKFKTENIIMDLDPNWTKVLNPDPNLIYLDPQHWMKIRNYVWLCSVEEELFYGIRPLRPTSWRKGGRSDSSGRLGLRRCFTTRNGYWSSHICVANFCDCLYFRDIFSYAICHGKFFVFLMCIAFLLFLTFPEPSPFWSVPSPFWSVPVLGLQFACLYFLPLYHV